MSNKNHNGNHGRTDSSTAGRNTPNHREDPQKNFTKQSFEAQESKKNVADTAANLAKYTSKENESSKPGNWQGKGESTKSNDSSKPGNWQDKGEFKKPNDSKSSDQKRSASPPESALTGGLKTIGDKIEQLGEKANQAGYPKVGKTLEALGDKVEHLNDRRHNN
ncbi:MAG: hypothetical protein ABIQ95_05895 [Bdellovibrionia bacterium]